MKTTKNRRNLHGNSARDMAINQASKPITIFDDSSNTHLYHIRSPEVPEIVVKNLDSSTSGSEGRNSLQKSRFNIYKSENGSPFIISDMNDNKILRSLGVSKLSSVPRTRKSNSETSEQIIISGEESEIEVESNQNSRNSRRRTKQRSHYDNTSISKMEQIQKRLDRQEEILETIARKLNQSDSADGRNVRSSESVRSNRSTQSTSNFTVPGLATDKNTKPEARKTPDYENMNPNEIMIYEQKFRNRFHELKTVYEKWDIKIPAIGQVSLRSVHNIYVEIVDSIKTHQTASRLKVYLAILFYAIEWFCYHYHGIKAFKNFGKTQIKTIHKYDCHLMEFAKMFTGDGEEWPTWSKFLLNLGSSIFAFGSVSTLAPMMGGRSAPELILHECDKFFSPSDGPAKYYNDGVPDVPEKPTGYQDPATILERGSKLIDSAMSTISGDKIGIPVAKPVQEKAKAMPKTDYDCVFD